MWVTTEHRKVVEKWGERSTTLRCENRTGDIKTQNIHQQIVYIKRYLKSHRARYS